MKYYHLLKRVVLLALLLFSTSFVYAQSNSSSNEAADKPAKHKYTSQVKQQSVKQQKQSASIQKKTTLINEMNLSELESELNIAQGTIQKLKAVEVTANNEEKINEWLAFYMDRQVKIEAQIKVIQH